VNSNSLLGAGDVAVQPTLVSGTNIKTLNSVSLLGSGDIVLAATPSGVAGAIQFSNGSAFASDAANLFWDDTNNRLGVGTNAPAYPLDVNGVIRANVTSGVNIFGGTTDAKIYLNGTQGSEISFQNFGFSAVGGYNQIGGNTTISSNLFRNGSLDLGARLGIRGSGSTSATTSLLVQNSAGTAALTVKDDLSSAVYGRTQFCVGYDATPNSNGALRMLVSSSGRCFVDGFSDGSTKALNFPIVIGARVNNVGSAISGSSTAENGSQVIFGSEIVDASAQVQINSTTRGFLPPKMTTTQKNAIASPAAGLVLYDSTTNKLQCYNGSTWNDLF
jgi:hypothetical protein